MKKCNLRPLYIKKYSKLPKNGQKRVKNAQFWWKNTQNEWNLMIIGQKQTKIDVQPSTKRR